MENRRVGILGGSFDPPTLAHEKLGECFLEALGLDEVRYVVAKQNPLKNHDAVGNTHHRWNMLMMMIRGHEKFSASDVEIQDEYTYESGVLVKDEECDIKSFAYNTLHAMQQFEPHTKFIFLGGSDILRNFYQWYKAEHFIREFTLGIAVRPPHSIASTIAQINQEHRARVQVFDRPSMPDMSSTDARGFFESDMLDRAEALMRPDIYEYAVQNQIYQIPQSTPA